MDNESDALSVQKLIDTGRALGAPFDHPQGGKAVVVPEGYHVQQLPPLAPELHHVKQTVKVLDAASFSAYLNRFKAPQTQVFADYRAPVIVGVMDYHWPENESAGKPDYTEHRVEFRPPWSEQWARWRAIDGKPLGQGDFAEFIEENYADIVAPPSAELLDVVANLQAKKSVEFQSGIRLQDGTAQLTYNEQIESRGKGTLQVPSEFSLGLPIFYGGEGYRIRSLLRYRINDGKLSFIVKINRREFNEQAAFTDILKGISEATSITPYSGSL